MHEDSALAQLIASYLNEDVFDFYGSVMAGVDAFVVDDPDLARELPDEIDLLLNDAETDERLDGILVRQGIGFVAGGLSYREWLTQIADRVRAATT